MALYARVSYSADGSTNVFAVPFGYLEKSHVTVEVDGVAYTDFTWPTTGSVQLAATAGSLSGKVIRIRRRTPVDEPRAVFSAGPLSPEDLNAVNLQQLYAAQENNDIGENQEQVIEEATDDAVAVIAARETVAVAAVVTQEDTSVGVVAAAGTAETLAAIAAVQAQQVISVAAVAGASGGIIQTSGTPTDDQGTDGNHAIDIVNNRLFGPKADGEWPLDYWDLGATATAVPPLPSGASIVVFAQDYESANKVIPNRVRPGTASDPLKVLTRAPRGCWLNSGALGTVGGSPWSSSGFTTTLNYAADLDGTMTAARQLSTGAGLGVVLYAGTISCVAGDYTIVVHVKSNTGVDQSWEWSYDGSSWTGFTVTSTMTRHTFEVTHVGTTNMRIRIRPASGVTGDISLGKFYLWAGDAASAPADLEFGGDGYIGNTPGDTVDCTTERLALSTAQCIHYDLPEPVVGQTGTIIAVTKRNVGTVNNGFRDTFLADILANTADNTFVLKEEETTYFSMTGGWPSSTSPKATFSPDYHALGGYHAHAAMFDATSREVWSDDMLLAYTQGTTNASRSIQHLQTGTNNGYTRDHHIAAILVWVGKKLTATEYRAALKYIDYYLESEGGVIGKPVNTLCTDGDSIMAGPSNESYVKKSLGLFTQPVRVHNAALSGSVINGHPTTTLNLTTRMPLHLASIPSVSQRAGRAHIFVVALGTNDLWDYYGGATAWLAAMEVQCAALMAAGWTVGVATILPKGTAWVNYASFNAQRAIANAALAGWVAAEKCHFIVDFAADATMGPDAAANNLSLYGDGLHPVAASHETYLGPIFRAAVNPFLLAA